MAERFFGFDSSGTAPGDRAYTAADYMRWMDINFGGQDGILYGYLNNLAATSLGGLQSSIDTGGCSWNGYSYDNTTSLTLTHSSVATSYQRYDYIVIRFDTTSTRSAYATIISGTAATSSPVVPTPSSTDIPLAYILIDNTSGTPVYTLTDARTYKKTATAPLQVSSDYIANSTITSEQMASYYKMRWYDGGTISGTLTLPTIEIGETCICKFFASSSSASAKLPSTGTFSHFSFSGNYKGTAMATVGGIYGNTGISGGTSLPFTYYSSSINGACMCIYTRTA